MKSWRNGVDYSAEVASAAKAGLEYWSIGVLTNMHHSNTPEAIGILIFH